MRQTALLRKEKLLQALGTPADSSSEEEASERANPFGAFTDSDEEEASEGAEEGSSASEPKVVLADMRTEPRSAPTVRSAPTARRLPTRRAASTVNVFAMNPKHFDCQRELNQGSTAPVASARGSSALQNNLWLLPHSQLMADIKKARSGLRWVEYDPESELYFRMNKLPGSETYNWEPTERYLSTWHSIEAFIGTGRLDEVFSFLQLYPYHPAANLCVAEYHVSQDQFDTAHQYLEKALSAFQYGLSHSLQLSKLRRPRLRDLDLRRMAQALSTLGNDLVVDWNTGESTEATRQEREAEIRAALSVPENGNLMFCKCVHLYALSLLQRGFARAALENFRLINVLTLGNDVSHSLLFLSEAAVRSRSRKVLDEYNYLYHEQTRDIVFQSVQNPPAPKPLAGPRTDLRTTAWSDRLEALFPSFLFGKCCLAVLSSGVRTKDMTVSVVEKILNDLTASEFREFVAKYTAADEEVMLSSVPDLRECCLQMLFCLWLHPNFAYALHQTSLSPSASEKAMVQQLSQYDHFTRKDLFKCEHEFSCVNLRYQLLEAYLEHTRDFWQALLNALVLPCAVRIGQLASLLRSDHGDELAGLCHDGLAEHNEFLDQYRGVRKSEFDPKKPVLADALINSSTESVDTNRGYLLRQRMEQSSFGDTSLGRWFNRFVESTRQVNVRENVAVNFLQTLMPWTRLHYA